MKTFTSDKYVYYLMALRLCQADSKGYASIGNDSGVVGGYKFWRSFQLSEYNGKNILIEKKSSPACADYSRCVEILNIGSPQPTIMPYINESGENGYKNWIH